MARKKCRSVWISYHNISNIYFMNVNSDALYDQIAQFSTKNPLFHTLYYLITRH